MPFPACSQAHFSFLSVGGLGESEATMGDKGTSRLGATQHVLAVRMLTFSQLEPSFKLAEGRGPWSRGAVLWSFQVGCQFLSVACQKICLAVKYSENV